MGGDHTFKAGIGWSRNAALPQGTAANLIGLFSFPTNTAFDPANARTYPSRFQIRVGQIEFTQKDWRTNFYLQDKWQVGKQLTLNLGVRYDYQHLTPLTKNAFAPRVGFAYDVTGSGKTLLRGGFGKYYQLHQLNVIQTLLTGGGDRPSVRVRHRGARVAGADRRRSPCTPTQASASTACRPVPPAEWQQRAGHHRPGVPGVPDSSCAIRFSPAATSTTSRRSTAIDGCHISGRSASGSSSSCSRTWRCRSTMSATAGATRSRLIDINEGPAGRQRPHHPTRRRRLRSDR